MKNNVLFFSLLVLFTFILNTRKNAYCINYNFTSLSISFDDNKDSVHKKLIIQADTAFLKDDYNTAISVYKEALKVFPNDGRLQGKIKYIDRYLNSKKTNEDLYVLTITMADGFFNSKEYFRAKIAYQKASKLRKDNKYSLQRIKLIDFLFLKNN